MEPSETGTYRTENRYAAGRLQADFVSRTIYDQISIHDASTGHRIAACRIPAGIVSVVSYGNAIFASLCNGDIVEVVIRPHQATGGDALVDEAESIETANIGTLIINTKNPGARVFIDGVKHPGSMEVQSTVSAGFHTVSVSLPAHKTYAETGVVESGGVVTVSAELAPLVRYEKVQPVRSAIAISGQSESNNRIATDGLKIELRETGDLVAVDSATGNILWRANAKAGSRIVDINHMGVMVSTDSDSELSFYAIENGAVTRVENGVYCVAAPDGIVAYCREWTTADGSIGMLRVFDMKNESRIQRASAQLDAPLLEWRSNSPQLQLESRRGTVFVNCGNELFAFDMAAGAKKWILENRGDGRCLGLHLLGEILLCVSEKRITAVDWRSGAVVWKNDAARPLRSWLPKDDGLIFFDGSAEYRLSVQAAG